MEMRPSIFNLMTDYHKYSLYQDTLNSHLRKLNTQQDNTQTLDHKVPDTSRSNGNNFRETFDVP